jgi:hypothetical protein
MPVPRRRFPPRAASGWGPRRGAERARIVLADDGQLLIDKARKFQYVLGQWADPEAFLKIRGFQDLRI